MSEPLPLPISLNFYLSSRADRNALDLIIKQPELPPDLRWDEVPAFHNAVSSARRLQTDYFELLYKGWEATWGAARRQILPSADQSTVAELVDIFAPTVEDVWTAGWLLGKIKLPRNASMWCVVACQELKEMSLSFYVDNGQEDYSLSDHLALSADWEVVDADHYRNTVPGLCPIQEEKFDPSRLASAAYQAIDLLVRRLSDPALGQ